MSGFGRNQLNNKIQIAPALNTNLQKYNQLKFYPTFSCWVSGRIPAGRRRFPAPSLNSNLRFGSHTDECYNPFMRYRRAYIPGGTYFFTVVTYNRKPIFSTAEAVNLLRNAFVDTNQHMPFTVMADVILPDHLHFIWSLPPDSSDYSTRWRLIKSYFTRHYCLENHISSVPSRAHKGEKEIWQRRFWEHLIRNESDLIRHVEYIHYNPVKHGKVNSPSEWQYSSFNRYVQEGLYPFNWGSSQNIWQGIDSME